MQLYVGMLLAILLSATQNDTVSGMFKSSVSHSECSLYYHLEVLFCEKDVGYLLNYCVSL